MKVQYLSRLDNNVGDIESSVYTNRRYLNSLARDKAVPTSRPIIRDVFPDGAQSDFSMPETWLSNPEMIIVGGGGLIGPPIFEHGWKALAEFKCPIIVWGVGTNNHAGRETSLYFPKFLEQQHERTFIALRNKSQQHFAPCPSILRPEFSHKYHPSSQEFRILGAYWHQNRSMPAVFRLIPSIQNNVTFDDAISFISTRKIVVTNSYHGTLWSRLLGKKVITVDQFSDKFEIFQDRSYGRQQSLMIKQTSDCLQFLTIWLNKLEI